MTTSRSIEEICSLTGEDAPRIIGRVFWWEVFD